MHYTIKKNAAAILVAINLLVTQAVNAQLNYFAGTNAGTGNTGTYVTGVGYLSINNANRGTGITGFGAYSLRGNTTGTHNTGIGYAPLVFNTTGSSNTAIGSFTLYTNSSGSYNVAAGANALRNNTFGSSNVAVGFEALRLNTTGSSNAAFGAFSLTTNATGSNTSAFGYAALRFNTSGTSNIAFGSQALYSNTTGGYNGAIGTNALFSNVNGQSNTAMGNGSMYSNISGSRNNAFGIGAFYENITGSNNTVVGAHALSRSKAASQNVVVGNEALFASDPYSSPVNCTVLGYKAFGWVGQYQRSIGIGYYTGIGISADGGIYYDNKFTRCILIGDSIFSRIGSYTELINAVAIGSGAEIDASYKVRIGNTEILSIGGQVGWTTFSDKRLKSNINKSKLGLDFILSLNPVTYNYKAEGQKDILYTGLIAQEVDEAAKKAGVAFSAVDKNGEMWGIRYGELTVPLIKAMQEVNKKMQTENEELKARIEKLEEAIVAIQKGEPGAVAVSPSTLFQNHPNPFNVSTVISFSLAPSVKNAAIIIRNMNAEMIKQITNVQAYGNNLTIKANELAAGTYTYSLIVNGAVVDTKLMVITR